ncbi:MAG: DUF6314 family protein [Pseudomonadota bacterium]
MPYPVQNLRAFLTGRWRIARRICDVRQDLLGRLAGYANFTAAPQGLIYDEAGLLRFGGYEGEAMRRYHFAFDRPGAAFVHHADGGLFHPLDLSSGKDNIRHRCAEDHYRGRYRVLSKDEFVVSWDVTGPRKRYRIATFYRRG